MSVGLEAPAIDEPDVEAAPGGPAPALRLRDALAALALLYAVLALVIGSVTSLNVALPAIGRSTGATQGELTWIADAYAVTFAALLLLAGALGDRWGRRRMLRWGLLLFALASLAVPMVASPDALIGVRAAAGLARPWPCPRPCR